MIGRISPVLIDFVLVKPFVIEMPTAFMNDDALETFEMRGTVL